jgi:hypothetical protein
VFSQDLTGVAVALGNNVQNRVGRSDSITTVTTTTANIPVVLQLGD